MTHQAEIDIIAPEFIGKNGEASLPLLEKAFPGFRVHVLPRDAMTTMDMRTDRIRVWCDPQSGAIEELING